ncbi:unnamed protein product, partial [Lymnaea stagnalis]
MGNGKGWAHPIHMHGHSFHVVKMGYPTYDPETGRVERYLEIYINSAIDTIIIPTGGYVVLRIKADNPGLWLMHCHIELHSMDGMILMFNESFARQPTPPSDLFKCG